MKKCLEIASCYAKKYNLIGVLSDQSDIATLTVAYVSKGLGLRGIGYDTALCFSDKFLMREACEALNIANPKYYLLDKTLSTTELLKEVQFPLVVKPRNSQSSRGVSIVQCLDELYDKVESAFEFSYGYDDVLLEEYIEGVEYTVEGFSSGGKNQSIAYSVKSHYETNAMVASSLCYPGDLTKKERERLFLLSESIVNYLGLEFGITHAEFIKKGTKFYLVEVAARGGGTRISSDIVPAISGVDMYELLLSEFLPHKDVRLPQSYYEKSSVILQFLDFEPGKVVTRMDANEVVLIDGVIDFNYSFGIGEKLSPIEDDRSRHAHLILKADSRSELMERLKDINLTVKSAMKYE
nr:ATP-grasp domain-containing protein [Vibrio sp. 99-8-1]